MLVLFGSISSMLRADDVLPEVGKTYLIKSDNVTTGKIDQDYYLYNDNGNLKLSTTKGSSNYLWTCEKNGEYFRFKNKAGKYLALNYASGDRTSIPLSDTNCDFTIDPSQKVNPGCLPLFGVQAERYMLVKNGGTHFNLAGGKYNKVSQAYSSDFIFEEVNTLTIQTEPANSQATFSWNGQSYTGACSFTLSSDEAIGEATLAAQNDPDSPYEFIGFYEGDKELGKTLEVAELTEDRTITAKFNFNPYSSTYGEKWIRITWNSNKAYVMGLPVSESYADVAPKTITSDLSTETQLWCLVGTAASFKIYNKAAGKTLALTTASTSYGDGTATFMKAEATATSWHLVSNKGWNISPVGNTSFGLNSYGGAGNVLKLYNNGDQGNIWQFSKSGDKTLTFQIKINGTPKALNTKVGQLSMSLGSITKVINVTTSQTEPQKFYLANDVNLGFMLSGTQYRGYKFKGFQVNDGALQSSIENQPFDASLKTVTAVYDVDTEDPSQYLFYTPGYQGHPYRIPAITTTKDNKVLAISDFRWDGADIGQGAVDLVGRISEDNGVTWSEQFNIAVGNRIPGDKARGYGDAAVVTDRESGRILIMCCTGSVFYGNGTRENPLRSARLYSEDNGQTWSKPEDITDQMYALLPNSTGQFIGAGKICQSRVTKVGEYYRLYAALCTRPNGNYVIYSDDFGQTWQVLGGNESSCAPNGDEPKCEELPDGSVVLSSRKYNGRYFNIYKYNDAVTATGKWLGAVSSNDIEGGLRVGNNSTNGEIQLVKVMKKADNTFHYMMIQSIPYGPINGGDEARSNVCIFYKVFDEYTMNATKDLATGWTRGMLFENTKGAYSTMCIQPDKKLGFFYEEGPNNYCMVYCPISIEELTGNAYTMYDSAIHGSVDELQRAVDLEKAKVQSILDTYANRHKTEKPATGECFTEDYNQLQAAHDQANKGNFLQLGDAVNTFYASCNWPVFTIDNQHPTYGIGKSIYDNNSGSLYFKTTDKEDKQMWWKFRGLPSETMAFGNYEVTNYGTGNRFWNAEFLSITATNPAADGKFIIKTNGSGNPVHAQETNSIIVRWDNYGPQSASAWSFTYVTNSFTVEGPEARTAFATALAEAKKYSIGTTVGTYTDPNGIFTEALSTALDIEAKGSDKASPYRLNNLAQTLTESVSQLVLNTPQPGKYYRFQGSTGAYLSSTGAFQGSSKPGRMMMTNTADANTVFYLTADNRLITPNATGVFEYFIEREGNGFGSDFTFEYAGDGRFYVVTEHTTYGATGRGSWYATAAGNPVDRWTNRPDGSAKYTDKKECAWIIEEVTGAELQLTREIGSTGYATLGAPVALNIPEGVKAYTVTVDANNEKALLTEITDGVIPAGCGVVLEKTNEGNQYEFTFAAGADAIEENTLVPLYKETTIGGDINAYILANKNNSLGFYQLDSNSRTIGANKAYLVLPATMSHVRSITIGGATTGIENTVTESIAAEEYYDLQGRRVLNPIKGIYVTKSGKKVIFNN